MSDRLHALAFNELSAALSTFVPLSEREEITRRVVAVVREEIARPDTREEILAHANTRAATSALREAANAAAVKPGTYWPHFAKWLRDRADRIEQDAHGGQVSGMDARDVRVDR